MLRLHYYNKKSVIVCTYDHSLFQNSALGIYRSTLKICFANDLALLAIDCSVCVYTLCTVYTADGSLCLF